MKEQKSMKKSLIITVSVLGIIILALIAVNFYFSNISNDENTPPKLPPTTERYQGALIDKEFGFYEYDLTDESQFIESEVGTFLQARKGLNYYYPKVDLSVGQIINEGIKPTEGLKVLFAYFSAEPTAYNVKDCFLVYPMGPYADTCPIPFNEIYDFVIPRNNGFIIISNKEFEYNIKLLADSNTMASDFNLNPPSDEEGWILRPLSEDVNLYDPTINAVWLQSGPDEFEEIADFRNIPITRPYKMAWIQIIDTNGPEEEAIRDEGATDDAQ